MEGEVKIKSNENLIITREEEEIWTEEKRSLTDKNEVPDSGKGPELTEKNRNAQTLKNVFQSLPAKKESLLPKDRRDKIRNQVERARAHLIMFQDLAGTKNPEAEVRTLPMQVSQLGKRMDSADRKIRARERILLFEKAQEEEEKENAGDSFKADCQILFNLTPESFKIADDREFVENLEENYKLIRVALRAQKQLLKIAAGEREGGLNANQRHMLIRQIAVCRQMKEWMDAKKELMKDPYYIYLAGKDVTNRQVLKDSLMSDQGEPALRGYRSIKADFLSYLNRLERVDNCAVNRRKLLSGDAVYMKSLEDAINRTMTEEQKEFDYADNRLQNRRFAELAEKNSGGTTADKRLTVKDKTVPKQACEDLKKDFLNLPLSGLKCATVEEILQNVSTNAPLINKALEMQNVLAQMLFDEETELKTEEVISLRAKIHVILSVSEMQNRLLRRTYRSTEEDLRGASLKEWEKKRNVRGIPDPDALFEKLKAEYKADREHGEKKAETVWTLLNKGLAPGEVEKRDRASALQKNTMLWENMHDEFYRIGKATGEVIMTLQKLCKDKGLAYRLPKKPVLFYMRGRSEEEMLSIYRRYTGAPKERYLLYKEIVDSARNAFDPKAFDYGLNEEGGQILSDFAHKTNLATIMEGAKLCSEEMEEIKRMHPELNENELADEDWHKEARALSRISSEKIMPMIRSLEFMTDSKKKRAVLSTVAFRELRVLFRNRAGIRSWLNSQENRKDDPAQGVRDILRFLEDFGACEESLTDAYKTIRREENIDERKLRNNRDLKWLRDAETDPARATEEELKTLRRDCLTILNENYNAPESLYYKLSAKELKELTQLCLQQNIPEAGLKHTIDMVRDLYGKDRRSYEEELAEARGTAWSDDQKKMMGFFADMAEFQGSEEKDREKRNVALQKLLSRHAETVAVFLESYDSGKRSMTDMPLLKEIRNMLGGAEVGFISSVCKDLGGVFSWIKEKLGDKKITGALVEGVLSERDGELDNALGRIDQETGKHLKAFYELCENSIGKWVDQAIGTEVEDAYSLKGTIFDTDRLEEEKDVVPQEKEEEINIHALLKKSLSREKGEGRYITIAMKNYFRYATEEDRRSMAIAMLRDVKPVPAENARRTYDVKQAGRYLGGMLKGAGPLFQKLMQGIPEDLFIPELRQALDDVKSNLAPISEAYVDRKLNEMMAQTNGRVTRIQKLQSLGAASVAETFLCRIYGENLPTAGKEVVIKILRPDALARLEREKKLLRVAARCTDHEGLDFDREMEKELPPENRTEGMEATHISQVNKILEEFDMTIEVENAKKGYKTYHSPDTPEVDTVKVNEDLPVSRDAYALDKAEGMTVERYLKRLRKKRKDPMKAFLEEDRLGYSNYRMRPDQLEEYEQTRSDLLRELEAVMQKQRMLLKAAEKWTEQAIYGNHFYHGDMHAGNIMISDNKVTILDYGNATTLTEHQRNHIMAMMSCTIDPSMAVDFLWSFTQLLPKAENEPEFKREDLKNEQKHPRLQGKGPEFLEQIKKILRMEDPMDPNNTLPGEKISLILKTAQEMGLQLPAEVENFSKSQLRLQNAISAFNQAVEEIRRDIRSLDTVGVYGDPKIDLVRKVHKDANQPPNKPVITLMQDAIHLFEPASKDEFFEAVKKKDDKGREEFENRFSGSFKDALIEDEETGKMVPSIKREKISEWRNKLEEIKPLAPKGAEDPSPEFEGKIVNLGTEVSRYLSRFSVLEADPLFAFGGTMHISEIIGQAMMGNNLETFENVFSLLENEYQEAVKYMEDYNKLKEIQDDDGFFNFFKSSKESELMESMYRRYVSLQKIRLNESAVIKDFRSVVNTDLDPFENTYDALTQYPLRCNDMKGDETEMKKVWEERNTLIRTLREKHFKEELTKYEEESAIVNRLLPQKNELVRKARQAEKENASDEEKERLEKATEEILKKLIPHQNEKVRLESVMKKLDIKLNPEEKKALKQCEQKVQEEFNILFSEHLVNSGKKAFEEEIELLAKEKEGGEDLRKAWREFAIARDAEMRARRERTEITRDMKLLRKEKERVLIDCWQRVTLARVKRHYLTGFETTEALNAELTDYMKVTGNVARNNKLRSITTLGSVSGNLVLRLRNLM